MTASSSPNADPCRRAARLTRRTRVSGLGLCAALLTGGAVSLALAVVPVAADAATSTPGAPSIKSVRPGDGRLVVSLRAPSSNGGSAVLGYVVTATAGTQSVSTNTTSTTATVTGLTDGVTYSVTAQALNANGLGPASAAVNGTPVAGPAPLSLTLTANAPTFVPSNTSVTYSGTLTRSTTGVGATAVFVTETYSDGKQVTLGQTATDSGGHYALTVVPLYNGTITVSALTASASVQSRVLVTLSKPRVTAQHGRSVTVLSSSGPGFVTGPDRVERAQLQELDSHGHVVKVLGTADAAQRVSRHGYAHGVNDITFRVVLPTDGNHRLAVKVIGTPVNTGATSSTVSVTATH